MLITQYLKAKNLYISLALCDDEWASIIGMFLKSVEDIFQ